MIKKFPFVRKAATIKDLLTVTRRYSCKLSLYEIKVIKEIDLDISQYDYFVNNLLEDHDFLSKYSKISHFDNSIANCLKVKCEDNSSKPIIYIVLEGTQYAKYSFTNYEFE